MKYTLTIETEDKNAILNILGIGEVKVDLPVHQTTFTPMLSQTATPTPATIPTQPVPAKAKPTIVPPPAPAEPAYTMQEVQQICHRVSSKDATKIHDTLRQFGVARLPLLAPEQVPLFGAAIAAVAEKLGV